MISLYDYDRAYQKRMRREKAASFGEGKAEGKAEGREEGRVETKKQMVIGMHNAGCSDDMIVQVSGESLETVQQWIGATA